MPLLSPSLAQTQPDPDHYAQDRAETLRNRSRLAANRNLLFWYEKLYEEQFREIGNIDNLRVLEVGSGTSPLRRFHPRIITSDVLNLDYLDYVFDCHHIDTFDPIADASLDIITLTNTLHHLRAPIDFLRRAASKLKRGGRIIATEPYFSLLSTVIYKYLHHEAVDFQIEQPELSHVRGPLSSSNQALAMLIFQRSNWRETLETYFTFEQPLFRPFTALAYFATGGISHRIPLPHFLYRGFFHLDLWCSRMLPSLVASFFTVTLIRK